MPCREDEAISIEPLRLARMVSQLFAEQDCANFGSPQRKTKVSGTTRVNSINRKATSYGGGLSEDF